MDAVAVWVRKGGEQAIIHRCRRCGALSSNRVAADDNPMKLMSIAMKPLCEPPFPLERIEEMTRLTGTTGSCGNAGPFISKKQALPIRYGSACFFFFTTAACEANRAGSAPFFPHPARRRAPHRDRKSVV